MRFRDWTLFLFLIPSFVGLAQEGAGGPPPNEFRLSRGTLLCLGDPSVPDSYLPCLHIGDLFVGLTLEETEAKIQTLGGRFIKNVEPNGEGETRLYALAVPKGGKAVPTLAVTYVKGKAESIRLTGTATDAPLEFSSICLGDSILRVVGLIGPPQFTETLPKIQSILWVYHPFPISIEIKEDRVYSILIQKTPFPVVDPGNPFPGL
jgi:hypothetical protein